MTLRGMLKPFRFLTIRQKLILTICGCTLFAIVFTSSIVLDRSSKMIERELINQGTIIASNLCKQSIEPILHDDSWEIYKSIKTVTGTTYLPFLKYIVVMDKRGSILAHSHPRLYRFGDVPPDDPFHEEASRAESTIVQSSKVSRGESLYDVTVPCMLDTEKLGTVRVGFTDERMRQELRTVKKDISLFALFLSLAGIGLGVSVAYRITGRLKKVMQNIVKISRGEFKEVIPVETAEKDEVGRMVDIFNEMARNLKTKKEMDDYVARKDKLAMLGEFSAGIAHEIKNPLTSIKMLMQAADQKRDALCHEDIEIIEGEINRIDRIVSDFLAFARPTESDYIPADINEILQEVVSLTRSKIERSRIDLQISLSDAIPRLSVYPDGMKQVFLNIVLNAVQAMEDGGVLRIRSYGDNGTVSISIADTGPGITEENLAHIFDPFFTTKAEGTGMGLAIADRIMREHRGDIAVDTVPGGGTTVVIRLPQ